MASSCMHSIKMAGGHHAATSCCLPALLLLTGGLLLVISKYMIMKFQKIGLFSVGQNPRKGLIFDGGEDYNEFVVL